MNFQKLFLPHNRDGNFFRKINAVINVILVLHQLFILCSEAYYLDSNPYRHKEILGPKASFVVEWSVNWKEKAIMFQVSAETKGWVGFGLSKDGRMPNSDVVIGGVDSFSGKPYFNDGYVTRNRSVQIDDRQDWKLIGAWEKGRRTYLSVTRSMDTCDFQDYPITKDIIVLIWAYGETDEIQYHKKRRGSVPVYLLDPAISEQLAHDQYRQIGPHSNLYLVQRWALTNKLRLSSRPTSVWCSVERGPRLATRHDIVGMGALLPTKLARQHVQKMLVYKCTSPQQTDAQTFFNPYARLKGEECYLNEKRTLPLTFCRELIYVWGRGGKPFYFPEDIGIPIGESQNEYFLLETHFDNPKNKADLDIEAGVEVIYSHRQKPNSASLLQIGYGPFGTFMLPPKTTMSVYGSCGPKCTSVMFPKDGADIFAAMLHSHSLGRRIRLKHFRNGGTELPWILKDDNYDSEFQQMRLLSKAVTILPGDQLTTECTFDSRDRNRTSFSGFSANDEVCSAFLYVARRVPFFRCTSEVPPERLLSKYGIRNFTWDLSWQDRYVTHPKNMEGTWIGDVVDDNPHLNHEQLQYDLKYSPHLGSCPNIHDMMGQTQNQLFRTFTNDWQQPHEIPVAITTPHLSSTVSHPRDVNEYQESSPCEYVQDVVPDGVHNILPVPEKLVREAGPRLPSLPIREFSINGVPLPPLPPTPPLQHQDFLNVVTNNDRPSPVAVVGNLRHRPPPLPPPGDFTLLNKNRRPPSVDDGPPVGIPVPLPPPPPLSPSLSSKFNSGPRLPIPPPHPRPPVQPDEFKNFLVDSGRDGNPAVPAPTGLRIPLIESKYPNPSTDNSITNFFDQIANIFSSTSENRNKYDIPPNGISYQNHINMNGNNNLFNKRKDAVP